jgi:hypothetical protein
MQILPLAVLTIGLSISAAEPDLWRYLPTDATAVSGIDVERTKNSPFGRYLLDQIADDGRDLESLKNATGFDPRRDLRTVIAAALPGRNQALFLARGSFDQTRILDTARREKATVSVHEGMNVIASQDDSHWIAFVDSTSVIAGPANRVRAAIAQAKNPASSPYLAQAQNLAASFDAWVVSTDPAGGLLKGIPANRNGDMLRSIRQASGGVRFGIKVEIDAIATARSDRDATALHDAIRFIAGMVRVQSEEHGASAVTTLLDSMRLSASGDRVSLYMSLPESELEKLIDASRQRTRRIAKAY